MERQTLIDQLEWLVNPDEFPDNHMWRHRSKLKSIVLVKAPKDQYTDDELEALVAFSARQTADYDRLWQTASQVKARDGCNAIVIGKRSDEVGTRWLRHRLSWHIGPMFSPTLAEAIEIFDKNLRDKNQIIAESC